MVGNPRGTSGGSTAPVNVNSQRNAGADMPAPVSKAQARFFGAIAGGRIKRKGFSRKEARNRLRGVKVSRLKSRVRRRRGKARRRKKR